MSNSTRSLLHLSKRTSPLLSSFPISFSAFRKNNIFPSEQQQQLLNNQHHSRLFNSSSPTQTSNDPLNPVIENDFFARNGLHVERRDIPVEIKKKLANPFRRTFPPLDRFHRLLDYTPYNDNNRVDMGVSFPRIKYPEYAILPNSGEPADKTLDRMVTFDKNEFRNLFKRVLVMKSVVQMTPKGKVRSAYVLVLLGNGKGTAGYGEAKASEMSEALKKATVKAFKNMEVFDSFENRTLYHDLNHKYVATYICLKARKPGFGKRVHRLVHEICCAVGIRDIGGKIYGARNPMNIVKGTFAALRTQRIPTDTARARGLKIHDVHNLYYGKN